MQVFPKVREHYAPFQEALDTLITSRDKVIAAQKARGNSSYQDPLQNSARAVKAELDKPSTRKRYNSVLQSVSVCTVQTNALMLQQAFC
jgi:hypothetical protein